MSVFSRKVYVTLIIMMLSLFTLSAGTYYIEWAPGEFFQNENIVRYRIGNGKWTDLPSDGEPVLSKVYSKNTTVIFEVSEDGTEWTQGLDAKLVVTDPGAEDTYNLVWKWNPVPGARMIRYSIDSKDWLFLTTDNTEYYDTFQANKLRTFRAESTADGTEWIEGAEKGIIVAEKQPVRQPRKMQLSLLGSAVFEDVYFTARKSAVRSGLAFGGKLSVFLPIRNASGITIDNEVSFYKLGVRNIIEYDPQIKIRFGTYDERGIAPYCMIGAGASVIMRDGRFYFYPALGADLGFDFWFTKQLALTFNVGASVSIQSDKLFNPGVIIDSLSIHATGSVGVTYAFCSKGGNV
ncbi:MAG: hypothetical protein ACI4NM_07245 [Bullifex sp.]